jgi:hypothetical protein
MNEYKWAIGTVRSRSFEMQNGSIVLVPFGDSLNHNATSTVSWQLKNGSIVLRATTDLSAEKNDLELGMNYGSLDASKMFAVYGFVQNISIWKATLLVRENKELGTPSSAFQLTTEIEPQALNLLHFICRQNNNIRKTTTVKENLKTIHDIVISHMNDFSSVNHISTLSKYPPAGLHQARRYRAGELHVLNYWKQLTEKSLNKIKNQKLNVGETCYIIHGNHFQLVRIVSSSTLNTGDQLFDVMFQSGTKVRGVKREDLLDEHRALEYFCSL